MIVPSMLNSINKALGANGYFRPEEFELVQKGGNNSSVSLEINYRFDTRFYFKASISNKAGDRSVNIGYAPGAMLQFETETLRSEYDLTRAIEHWVGRVNGEMISEPVQRRLDQQRREVEELASRLGELPNEYYSKDEAEEMRNRLSDLESNLLQRLQETIEDQGTLKTKTAELHAEVEALKRTLEILKKPGWAGSFMARMGAWFAEGDNKALLKTSAAEVSKQLLIEAGKEAMKGS